MKISMKDLREQISLLNTAVDLGSYILANKGFSFSNVGGKLHITTANREVAITVNTGVDADFTEAVSVHADTFQRLIMALTEDEGHLEIGTSVVLTVRSNEYKFPTLTDMQTALVFNGLVELPQGATPLNVKIDELQTSLKITRVAAPEDFVTPALLNICYDDKYVVGSNEKKVIRIPNVTGYEGIIPVGVIPSILAVTTNEVKFYKENEKLYLQGAANDGSEFVIAITLNPVNYPEQYAIQYTGIVNINGPSLTIPKDELQNVIKRCAIFVTNIDDHVHRMELSGTEIRITNNVGSVKETIPVIAQNEFDKATAVADIVDIEKLVATFAEEVTIAVTESALIMQSGDVNSCVALFNE